MSDMIAVALTEAVRTFGSVRKEEARYAYLSGSNKEPATPTPKIQELTMPDVELNNYVKRSEVGEDNQHVLVVEHSERLEKKYVPVPPPTAEEIEAERVHKRYLARVWGTVTMAAVAIAGIVVMVDRHESSKRAVVQAPVVEI